MNGIEVVDITSGAGKGNPRKDTQTTGEAFVGKDILELISVSMYVEPLTMYREYIQNATDSIDQAVESGLLQESSDGRIDVAVSQASRSIKISDNGAGISSRKFAKTMLAFGASEKRGTEARGFRGVGRFAGLGYCQKLIFRSKSKGETNVSEVEWDGRILKRLLADNSESLSIADLVKKVATFSVYSADDKEAHFFEVELQNVVRMGSDVLLNEDAVKRYISQVCPVPYASTFKFKKKLETVMEENGISTGYNILVGDDYSDPAKIHRPYSNEFQLGETEADRITGVDIFTLNGVHGEKSAIGWIFEQSYKGLIPSASNIRGIRVRVGNTQIGEEALMVSSFPEPRFNSWTIGEVHILERRITPNGRRDNFDNNVHWLEVQNQFSAHSKNIAKVCRKNSAERNVIKQFSSEIQKAKQFQIVLASGVLSKSKSREIGENVAESLVKAEKLSQATHLGEEARLHLGRMLDQHRAIFSLEAAKKLAANDIFDVIPKNKVSAVREVFDFVFDCSPNKVVAQSLIDKIVEQYRIRYS